MNKQVVALPYQKFGLQVYESGINYVVDIPRLEAQISYNGLSFSIRLPYHLFGNNTKGQCGEFPQPLSLEGKAGCEHLSPSCGFSTPLCTGTCTNDTADDCILPSGEIISDCEVAADEWLVNDPSKPHCPQSSFTTKRPAITTAGFSPPENCTVSPICELIKGR